MARVPGVYGVEGMLWAVLVRQEGEVPAAEAVVRTGGEQVEVEQAIPPLTAPEREAVARAVEQALVRLAERGFLPSRRPGWKRCGARPRRRFPSGSARCGSP